MKITDELILKMGFENWGEGKLFNNEYERYTRFVLHNFVDGSSNLEIHKIRSVYDNKSYYEYVLSIDEDERIKTYYDLDFIHQIQNLTFAITGNYILNVNR